MADHIHEQRTLPQRRVMGLADFTDSDIAAIAASEAPGKAASFDAELEQTAEPETDR